MNPITLFLFFTYALGQNPVSTTSGYFAPYHPPSHQGIVAFLDIPYAQCPTEDLRFAPPVRAKPPTNNAVQFKTKLPRGCIQYLPPYLSGTVGTEAGHQAALFQRRDYTNTTEDCLRLSIFAPRCTQASKLPVIVWIHGGGYVFGGTNVPYQLAPDWVQRSQAHIVVQVQYRLNLFGLPNAAALQAKQMNLNFSLLDQRMAVEWVRDNIGSFGGDTERIILWGESAGAYAVDGYLHAWEKDPIVSGVIADSGNALLIDTVTSPVVNTAQFSSIAKRFGCEGPDELNCMRRVPEHDLKDYIQTPAGAAAGGLSFSTVIDNVTIFSGYADRITRRQFASRIPVLIGTNSDEGNAVVPYDFPGSGNATSLPASLQPIADSFGYNMQCATIREVRLRESVGAPTWQYFYSGNFSDISPRPWLGAYHTAELPLIFGTYGIEGQATPFEKSVSEYMQDMWLAFATDPQNGLEQRDWPRAKDGKVMEIANGNIVGQIGQLTELKNDCIKRGLPV